MFCPECGIEYREGFLRCTDCDVPLVEGAPPQEGEPDMDIVKVFTNTNPATLPLVESVLREANIEYMTKSRGMQDVLTLAFGLGLTNAVGPTTIWVRKDDEAEARELLADIEEPMEPSEAE